MTQCLRGAGVSRWRPSRRQRVRAPPRERGAESLPSFPVSAFTTVVVSIVVVNRVGDRRAHWPRCLRLLDSSGMGHSPPADCCFKLRLGHPRPSAYAFGSRLVVQQVACTAPSPAVRAQWPRDSRRGLVEVRTAERSRDPTRAQPLTRRSRRHAQARCSGCPLESRKG